MVSARLISTGGFREVSIYCLSPSFWWPQVLLGLWKHNWHLCSHTGFFSEYFSSSKNTALDLGTTLIQDDIARSYLIATAKILFSNQLAFIGPSWMYLSWTHYRFVWTKAMFWSKMYQPRRLYLHEVDISSALFDCIAQVYTILPKRYLIARGFLLTDLKRSTFLGKGYTVLSWPFL